MKFQSLSPQYEIGNNSYRLIWEDAQVILDSGMHPKREGLDALPDFDILEKGSIDCIFISHSHLDHIGALPVLSKKQPQAKVFMTPAGYELTGAILHNSVNVMQKKREELGISDYPFYSHKEIGSSQKKWIKKGYKETFSPLKNDELKTTFYNSGHILGSSGILLEREGKRIFYTGDVQFQRQNLIPEADFPEEKIDVLIMETTRGNTPKRKNTREEEKQKFIEEIRNTLDGDGCVLVPVFAMGKTQEVLTMIYEAQNKEILGDIPIFIGGLSTKMTKIFDSFASSTPRNLRNFEIMKEMKLEIARKGGKHLLRPKRGHLFILSSGMLVEKTPSFELAKKILPNQKDSILFVGYADPETPGGIVKANAKEKKIDFNIGIAPIERKCKIQEFDFSGHAERDDLLDYAIKVNPKIILLVHGDEPAVQWFKEQLSKKLPETKVIIPENQEIYELNL